jgi:uncharacterized protein YigA (DUF484 family)
MQHRRQCVSLGAVQLAKQLKQIDLMANRVVWFEDNQIAAEIMQMRTVTPEQWSKPLPLETDSTPILNATHDGHAWRRVPHPLRLLDDAVENPS